MNYTMNNDRTHISAKKWICGAGGMLLCILFCLLPAPDSLSSAAASAGSSGAVAMRILGITLFAICWWVGEIVADWIVAILMLLLWVLIGQVSFPAAFSAFGSTSVWLIVGAFCLAESISKTGLFKRISWSLIRLFSPTFRGQVLAMLLVGTVCAPLVPSATAKAVLGASIANNIANAMGYPPNSRGRCGLFIASFIGFSGTTPAFMSGSVFTYTLLGALPEAYRADIAWVSWSFYALPWLLVILVGSFFAIQFVFSPKEATALTPEYIKEEYEKLGSMGRQEKISAVLLAGAVLLWILESRLGIDASVTALGAACLCFATGLLSSKEISTAVPWGLVIFLGGVLNLGNILSKAGIDIWLQSVLAPLFTSMRDPVVFIAAVALMVIVLRLILVSQSATVIILMAVLAPVAISAGIHPFAIGFVVLTMQQCWFLSYQNVVFTPALSCMQGSLSHNRTVSACGIFELLALAGLLISIPLWKLTNLM